MVEVIENGNIFDSNAKYITNAVNCVGIMGAGIAKQFADRYPKMYETYQTLCRLGVYEVGRPRIQELEKGKYVINFPTMKNPGSRAKLSDIINGLNYIKQQLKYDYEYDYTPFEVAFCALGCPTIARKSSLFISEASVS